MIKRFSTFAAILSAAVVMAAGGVALAGTSNAAHKKSTHHAAKHHKAKHATRASRAGDVTGVDTDNVQSGDQSADAAASQGSAGEQSSETQVNDGPGGHEDAAGAELDHQFEGGE
jgi:hypothetical protein